MAEFIGARISLVSKSDIRYVGTLHEINSETSTVALEKVSSFGTEGRKSNPEEEIPPNDSVYEYIVFRGSDVKDLRIEEAPALKENKPPQIPNDPAILGSGSRPPQAQAPPQHRPVQNGPPQTNHQQSQPGHAPPFAQHQQHPQQPYPGFYPPPPGGWGRGGPSPTGGFPQMSYGGPPGWYPPPQGFQGPGHFPPYGYPPGPPGSFQQQQRPRPAPIGPGIDKQPTPPPQADSKQTEQPIAAEPLADAASTSTQKAPTPPIATKPSQGEVKAAISQTTAAPSAAAMPPKTAPAGPRGNRVEPAIPLRTPPAVKSPLQTRTSNTAVPASNETSIAASLRDATQAATAAVAAAMAKLPPVGQTNGTAMDNLTKKVNEMRTSDPIRAPRNPGVGGFTPGRGGHRGGRGGRASAQKVEVPATDFDFEESNAKFSKQDLVKEAIAGSPLTEEHPSQSPTEPEVPVASYNKASSFFDNISSESKDRMEAGAGRPGGREWRGEEQKKNVETFGQGSVDNGYRGGYRGRGRGRGGYRGRGYAGNGQPLRGGRGGFRGRGDAQVPLQ